MQPAYMPFTYLPASTARILAALAGPVVVYRPLDANIPASVAELAAQGVVDLRTPIAGDEDRLRAALAEFMEWARVNPSRSTAGTGFWGVHQGEIPFFDETAVHRIRSDIRRHRSGEAPGEPSETGFTARLFLALAQENDLAMDRLDHELDRIDALENAFLATLEDADDAAFSRRVHGERLWRDDPGARMTAQRIRAWAGLAAADVDLPQWLITTSPAVMAAIVETHGADGRIAKLADLRLPVPSADASLQLGEMLAPLAVAESDPSTHLAALNLPAADAAGVAVHLYVAAHRAPAEVIGQMARRSGGARTAADRPRAARHTLLALVDI